MVINMRHTGYVSGTGFYKNVMTVEEFWNFIVKENPEKIKDRQDTYFSFDEATPNDIRYLMRRVPLGRYNDDPLKERQNESYTVGTFLKYGDKLDKMRFIGYVVMPPRTDSRVSIEGFTADHLTEDEVKTYKRKMVRADERDVIKDNDDLYFVRAWWD